MFYVRLNEATQSVNQLSFVKPNEAKCGKIMDEADFANHETCSLIRLMPSEKLCSRWLKKNLGN